MSVHYDFIVSPISTILEEGVRACSGINEGIENIAVCDYIMQSLFLKMTGFQEQKLKCICWDLATDDYEYRYKRFSQKPLGECSCYDEKNTVMNDLIELIKKYNADFDIDVEIDKTGLIQSVIDTLHKIFNGSVLKTWAEHEYQNYEQIYPNIQSSCYLMHTGKTYSLFPKCDNCGMMDKRSNKRNCGNLQSLLFVFDKVYKYRNRCAHNTFSYQQNLPSLNTLSSPEYIYENYFVRFAVIMLIDNIFVLLYNKYNEFRS